MNVRELRQKNDEELLNELEDLKEAQFKLRLQAASGQLENENVLRQTRRDIARVKTILRERQLAAQLTATGDR